MIDTPELGYTPANLRAIRAKYKLTQQDVADMTDTANYRTVCKWEVELDRSAQRADMPHKKWLMLIKSIKQSEYCSKTTGKKAV